MWFIGDIHGRFSDYFKLIKKLDMDCSLQLGDFGNGSILKEYPPPWNDQHKFLRGNHDVPKVCREHPNYLGDYGYLEVQDMYYISGAWSIDHKQRIMGLSVWEDEELTYVELQKVIQEVQETKPRIIVSHDCPSSIRGELFGFDRFYDTKTGAAFSSIFEAYQPTWWLFGHYHRGKQAKIKGTHFVCLQELECCEIPDIKWQY